MQPICRIPSSLCSSAKVPTPRAAPHLFTTRCKITWGLNLFAPVFAVVCSELLAKVAAFGMETASIWVVCADSRRTIRVRWRHVASRLTVRPHSDPADPPSFQGSQTSFLKACKLRGVCMRCPRWSQTRLAHPQASNRQPHLNLLADGRRLRANGVRTVVDAPAKTDGTDTLAAKVCAPQRSSWVRYPHHPGCDPRHSGKSARLCKPPWNHAALSTS